MDQAESGFKDDHLRVVLRSGLLFCLFFPAMEVRAQSLESISVSQAALNVNDPVFFTVKLDSKTGTYACAFDVDFGDGSAKRRFRVFSEKDATVDVSHVYRTPGLYAAKVDGVISLLDEGISLKSFGSLLPAFPCEGSKAVAVNVVTSNDKTCIPPPDESREVACSDGTTGQIVQRRSYSCPGPTAQPWVTERSDCKGGSNTAATTPEAEAAKLINRGWASFVGKSGGVDEFEAFRLTAEGLQKAGAGENREVSSIAKNNLRVIHKCARDPRVRDYSLGQKVASKEVGKNRFSSENYIWGVFLRTEEADPQAFIKFLKTELRSHPVTGYIERNSGRLPGNNAEALRILKGAAVKGDYNAAKWVGYSYECGPGAIRVSDALKWMSLAAENAEKKGAAVGDLRSINERVTRLRLISQQ